MDSFFSNEAYFCVVPKSVFKKLLLSIIDDWCILYVEEVEFGLNISIKDARLMQIFGLAMFLILML